MVGKLFFKIKGNLVVLLLVLMTPVVVKAQSLIQDEVTAVKMWLDEDGDTSLFIKVSAACNNYDSKRAFEFIGLPSTITLKLKNDHIDQSYIYEHPRYDSSMLMFYSEAVWFAADEWKQAVFIPLFYCSQKHGATMPLTYLILYDQKMHVVQLTFQCKPQVWGSCTPTFQKRALKRQLTQIPPALQTTFIEYIEKTYTTREDLFPNHMTFKQQKYKDWNLASVVSIVEASYPHELLARLHTFIEDEKWELATAYLNEFEYLYVDQEGIVVISGFRNSKQNYKEQAERWVRSENTLTERSLEQALQYSEQGDFQRAYDWYKTIMEQFRP
ncbi:hypothetical protein [Myroides sp. WP-1]|uniref:hypothetical protein n=1 Tax=Myroides sp. WP-1 TaxID=2759944 RepID=UPI0021078F45|nr:hypothetical protein [Myroides sp. WP-1]